jgi:hypothetical protein
LMMSRRVMNISRVNPVIKRNDDGSPRSIKWRREKVIAALKSNEHSNTLL